MMASVSGKKSFIKLLPGNGRWQRAEQRLVPGRERAVAGQEEFDRQQTAVDDQVQAKDLKSWS